jgi:hypothetical protein
MSRYLTDDYINHDPRALLNVEKMATLCETAIPVKQYITAASETALQITEGCIFSIGGVSVVRTDAALLSVSHLDSGASFQSGKDYYVYICDPGGNANSEIYKISLNATYPAGFGPLSSRKIGGFHYGKIRKVNAALEPVNNSGTARGSGWESNVGEGIVPASVWTLAHRPKSSPEGMVYLTSGVWVDIYLASNDGAGGLRSANNATPLTGTENLNWYSFTERALVSGKRLLSYGEWIEAAYGSPQGQDGNNTYAWAATANTARKETGYVTNAVSSVGCRDCVGNVYEWLNELVVRWDTPGSAWAWHDVLGSGNGKAYMYSDHALVALFAGGSWNGGVNAGCRTVGTGDCPWDVDAGVGARCACDSL